ncbi:hypothetical protein GCM10010440_61180 [Kitasatospora cinereorecta]
MIVILRRMTTDTARPDGPRAHHYRFAHQVLPGLARDLGPQMLDNEPRGGFTAGLASLWQGLGETLPESERLPGDGLSAELVDRGGHRMLLVELPRPSAPAEAYLVAVAQPAGADHCRCFTLEHGVSPLDGQAYTVLAEWADRSHINLGPGPAAQRDAFVAAVEVLLTEPAEPYARTRPRPEPEPEAQPVEPPRRRGLRGLFGR